MKYQKPIRLVGIIITTLLILWLVLSGILVWISPGMIFITERSIHTYPETSIYEQEFYDLDDGTSIEAIFYDSPRNNTVILYLHGNAGRIPHFATQIGNSYDHYSPLIQVIIFLKVSRILSRYTKPQ